MPPLFHARGDSFPDVVVAIRSAEGKLPVCEEISTFRERLLHAMDIGSAQKEFRMQVHAALARLPVALPLAIFEAAATDGSKIDVIVMEDLGSIRRSDDQLKNLLHNGDAAEASGLEVQITALTRSMMEAGIINCDQRLANLVVRESNNAMYLLGFEHTRRFRTAGSRHLMIAS